MTSRSISGGNEQSTGSLHRGSTHDYLPQFHTYASAAYPELAASIPLKARTGLRGAPGKKDHALFPARFALKSAQLREALLNVLLVGGAIGLIVTVAAAAFLAPYILFFVET